ncbi:MAG TPA: hypothetical protein VEF36_07835, partial [Roseiarcus sp.]|nr:hypothetical protein [Roseiarcus sp.]
LHTFAEAMSGDNAALGRIAKSATLGLMDAIGGPEGGEEPSAAATAAQSLDDKLKAIQASATEAKSKMHELFAAGGEDAEREAGLQALKDAMTVGKSQVPQMDLAGAGAKAASQALEATLTTLNEEVTAYEKAAKEKEKSLDDALKYHNVTMSQWLAASRDALAQEYADVKATYDKELAQAGLTANKIAEIKKQEADKLRAIDEQWVADQRKALDQVQQEWQNAFNTINGAIDSQINGLLRGTTSWAQAVKNVLATLTEDVIKFFVNWGLQQAETVVKNIAMGQTVVTAHVAGDAQMAAADQAAGAAGGLAWLGNILKAIQADAAAVFGGVFGFLAPVMGPAAAGPAAAASASVLAAPGLSLYDSGAWEVPHDMIAGIHAGEMIVPQRGGLADEFRAFAAGGGFRGGAGVTVAPTSHVHIHSMDSQTVASTLRGNGGALLKSIERAVRDGAHHGLRLATR